MRYCFLRKIENVNSLIEGLVEFEEFCPQSEIVATDEKVQYYSKAIIVYWFFGNVMNCVSPLLDKGECMQNRKSDLYRERDPCGLMARCFYPFDVSKTLFPMAYFIQVYTCGMITYYIVVLTMTLVGIMMHTLTQLQYCRTLIRNLEKDIASGATDLARMVRRVIRYHIKIIDVLRISNLWPRDDNYVYNIGRGLKDMSLILSLMPCALPILADFSWQLYSMGVLNLFFENFNFLSLEGVYNLTALTENLIALNCIVGMIYMTICFIQKRKLIKNLVKTLDIFDNYSRSSNLIETDKKANLYAKLFLFYGILGNIVYMMMPQMSVEKCKVGRARQAEDLDIPCGLVTRCRFPFKFDYSPVFEIVFVHQFYTCTMVTVIILDLTMLLCGFLIHITNQLKHLRTFVVKLSHNTSKNLVEEVRFCVKYHIAIITYSEKTNEAFSTMMMLHLTLTSLVISALGFEILIVDNFNDSLRFTLHLLGWLVLLLLICYYGQILIDESVAVAEDIYFIPWHLAPVKIQKDIMMILMRSQKPLTLSAANIGVIFLFVAMVVYWFFGNVTNFTVPLLGRDKCSRQSKIYEERDPCGLMTQSFHPFDVSKELFPFAYFTQVYACLVITYYVVALTLTMVGIMIHTLAQLEYCRILIRGLSKDIVFESEDLALRVKRIIHYHIKIIEYSEKTNDAFSTMMMVHLTLTSLVISALGFEIIIVGNIYDSFRFALHLFGWLVVLLLSCYYGQILIDKVIAPSVSTVNTMSLFQSAAVAEDVYSVAWYQAPVDIQKDVLMVLMRSQKPLTLSAANLGVMSFPTFLSVIIPERHSFILACSFVEGNISMTSINENIIALSALYGLIYIALCFMNRNEDIKALVEDLSEFEFYSPMSLIEETENSAKFYTKLFITYGIVGNVCYGLIPLVNYSECQRNRPSHMLTFGIPCGLVVRMVLPFKYDYSPMVQIAALHEIAVCTLGSTIIIIITMLICGVLIHVTSQLKYLKSLISDMSAVTDDTNLQQKIQFCVKFHTAIIDYATRADTSFSQMMLLHITLTAFVISVLGFEITTTANVAEAFRFAMHLTGWLGMLFIVCYYGQTLMDESSAIAVAIYSFSWYEKSVVVQKYALLILLRSQKPLTLKAAGLNIMSLATFLG
ncbi:odorant receptor 67c-like, partial [Asbolus verrucosus]